MIAMTTYSPAMADYVERQAQAVIASMAHMTDGEIQHWIDRLVEERSLPLYAILVSSSREEKSGTDLFMFRRELDRRASLTLPATQEQAA